jgi:hypothetical protein
LVCEIISSLQCGPTLGDLAGQLDSGVISLVLLFGIHAGRIRIGTELPFHSADSNSFHNNSNQAG